MAAIANDHMVNVGGLAGPASTIGLGHLSHCDLIAVGLTFERG